MIRAMPFSVLAILALNSTAPAVSRTGFDLASYAWNATHIVVVTEGFLLDGKVEVLDCWKGDLKKGEWLTIPELATFAPREARAIENHVNSPGQLDPHPDHVTGKRIILFLIQEARNDSGNNRPQPIWKMTPPITHSGAWPISAAWIEQGKAYYVPDKGMVYAGMTVYEMKKTIDGILLMKNALEEAMQQKSLPRIQQALNAIRLSDSSRFSYARVALDSVARMDGQGPSILRTYLEGPHVNDWDELIFESLQDSKEPLTGAELARLLDRETAFWKERAKTLERGWWSQGNLSWRAYMDMKILKALGKSGCLNGRKSLLEFNQLLEAHPPLGEYGYVAHSSEGRVTIKLSDTCAQALKELSMIEAAPLP